MTTRRSRCVTGVLALSLTASLAGMPHASAATESASPPTRLGQYSGFEGREAELGRAVAAAIRQASPGGAVRHDFTGREEAIGFAMATVIRTLNHDRAYAHQMNDALVKMTLDHVQAAKTTGTLEAILEQDVRSTAQQLERVRRLIERTGNRDLALVAIFEQTTCFFQLVDRTERSPGSVTYRSPFGQVLGETTRMGIHDLTEREIHEIWTVPRMKAYARILGVELDVSPWREDGLITVSVR